MRRSPFLDGPISSRRDYSEVKASAIDAEVEGLLDTTHERVRQILTDRRHVLEQVARRLLEKEVMEGDELRALLAATTVHEPAAS